MALKWRQEFVVEGKSTFPIDMLRSDRCSPYGSEDASQISLLCVREHGVLLDKDNLGVKRIKLVRYSEVKNGGPTVGRWKSFGWDVVGVETIKV